MGEQVAIFAASLLAVGALVLLAHYLGFSAPARIADEGEAREALALLPGGFAPALLALGRDGKAAIARDASGRFAVVTVHGGRLVARLLSPAARFERQGSSLVIRAAELGPRTVTLDLGGSAADWAHSSHGTATGAS